MNDRFTLNAIEVFVGYYVNGAPDVVGLLALHSDVERFSDQEWAPVQSTLVISSSEVIIIISSYDKFSMTNLDIRIAICRHQILEHNLYDPSERGKRDVDCDK